MSPAARNIILALGALSLIYFLPPAVFFGLGASSHSAGLSVACFAVIVAITPRTAIGYCTAPLIILALALVAHLTLAALFQPPQVLRALLSFLLLGAFLVAALSIGSWLFSLPDQVIERTLSVLRIAMVAIAMAGVLGFQPPFGYQWDKPVFPFTEPSHFALVFTPLVIHACVTQPGWRRYAWLLVGYALAVLLQNLTLLAGVTLAALACLPVLGILSALGLLLLASGYIDIGYYVERLDFGPQTRSLSALVYLQGWELASDAFARTSGWGLGFQQLGYGVINSPAADVIFMMIRRDLNLPDGGFVAAKLIGEFGIFGMALAGLFIGLAVRMGLRLRLAAFGRRRLPAGEILALSIICGYTVDMFARGVGYFTGTSFMFVSALLYLLHKRAAARSADPGAPDEGRQEYEFGQNP